MRAMLRSLHLVAAASAIISRCYTSYAYLKWLRLRRAHLSIHCLVQSSRSKPSSLRVDQRRRTATRRQFAVAKVDGNSAPWATTEPTLHSAKFEVSVVTSAGLAEKGGAGAIR